MKPFLKKLLPTSLVKLLTPLSHLLEAFLANLIYMFPGRKMNVIAVTGTNGKTTTSAFIASILKEAGYKYGVSSTAFYEINGVKTINDTNMTVTNPFEVQKLLRKMRFKGVKWVVLETTSHALIQKRVWGIPIKAAVMTNLSQDHLDYHGTMEKYAEAKGKLFAKEPEVIVLNQDDEWFEFFNKFEASSQKITYGTTEDAEARIEEAKLTASGSSFKMTIDHSVNFKFNSKLIGKFNVYNAAAAIATTYALHIPTEAIVNGVENLELVDGRMESIDEGQKFNVLVDYAHTPDALENVLQTSASLTKNRIILVFGATGDRDKAKRPIMGEIAANNANRLFITDEETYSEDPAKIRADVLKGVKKAKALARTKEIADRKEAIEAALRIAKPEDTVLITGMGHQSFMKTNDGKIEWDDRAVTRELLKKILKK